MAEGDKVTVTGVIVYDYPGNDWVEIKFAEGPNGRAIVPRSLLPASEREASDEDRIRDAMDEARDYPGRTITR